MIAQQSKRSLHMHHAWQATTFPGNHTESCALPSMPTGTVSAGEAVDLSIQTWYMIISQQRKQNKTKTNKQTKQTNKQNKRTK